MRKEDFEKAIKQILIDAAKQRKKESRTQKYICLKIYEATADGKDKWIKHGDLAREVYEKDDEGTEENLRTNIRNIRTKCEKYFVKKRNVMGFKIVLRDREEKIIGTRSKIDWVIYYRFDFIPAVFHPRISYTGRTTEIRKFEDFLKTLKNPRAYPHILSLHGFGGVGKTILLRIFRKIAEKQEINVEPRLERDGVVTGKISDWLAYMLSGYNVGQKMSGEVWTNFLRVLKPNTVIFIDTTRTADVEELNHVLGNWSALLGKEGPPILIVTATRIKPLHHEEFMKIGGLSTGDIKELVRRKRWNPEIIQWAKRLRQKTGGNPFVIERICGYKKLWEKFKAGKLNLKRDSDDVAGLLKEMWELLTEPAVKALKTISVLSHYSTRWQYVWGRKECEKLIPSWDDIFVELRRRSFINEPEEDFYEVHEFITDYAKPEKEKSEIERIGNYFSKTGEEETAIRFHVETGNLQKIRESFRKAIEQIRTWKTSDLLAGRKSHRYRNFIALTEKRIFPLSEGDWNFTGEIQQGLGYLYDMTGHYKKAVKFFQHALKSFQKARREDDYAYTLVLLGDAHRDYGDFDSALKEYQKVLNAKGSSKEFQQYKAESLLGIGDIQRYQCKWHESLKNLGKAKSLFKKIEKYWGLCDALWSEGYVKILQNNYKGAESVFKKILQYYEDYKDKEEGVDETYRDTTQGALGDVLRLRGEYEESLKLYEEAGESIRIRGDTGETAWILAMMGHSYLQLNMPEEADRALLKAETIGRKTGNQISLIWILQAKAELERCEKRISKARKCYLESQRISESHGLKLELAHSYLGLAETYKQERKNPSELYRKALEIYKEIGSAWGVRECQKRFKVMDRVHPINFP